MPKKFKSWTDFDTFSNSVKRKARFVHERRVITFLNTLLETSNKRHHRISAGKYVWRAQLGCAFEEHTQDDAAWKESVAFPPVRMKPLPHVAHEGRVNPKGIPCLYVSSNKETAMAEVRPWVGSSVSVGQLQTMRDLTLIDFSQRHDSKFNFYFEEPPPAEREKHIWEQVDRAFSTPVTSDMATAEYVPTQVIAEFFKQKGFDGIVYKSQLGPGFNIALFDLEVASVVNCCLYTAKSVSFMYGEIEHCYQTKPAKT
jgi:hypothetical protein